MADLNFPNPGVQTTYSFVGKTWNWDGQRWAFASSGSGITKLNELTSSVQNFLIGYSGTFPNIVSSGSDHTFNFPLAGIAATGLVNTSAQTFAGAKTFASTTNATYIGDGGVVVHGGIAISGNAAIGGSAIFTNTSNTNTLAIRAGVQASTLTYVFPIGSPTSGQILSASAPSSGVVTLTWADDQIGAPAGGIQSLNGLNPSSQSFQTGTDGVDFGISSTTSTHTFNLPDASATARGVITTGTQTIAGAKTFSSSIIGNLTGTATTAQNINTTAATGGGAHYLLFSPVNATTSGVAVSSDAQLQFNPGTNVLTADVFSGNLSGTAATVTNFYGTLTGNVNGNVTGTATTAQNVNVTATTLSNNFYLTFANASFGSGLALSTSAVGAGLTFNPATSSLSAVLFTGTATSSRNIDVSSTTLSNNFNILFASASSGSGLALSTSSVGVGLTFNPATSSLSAVLFTGTATTSRNVSLTTTALNGIHYLTFANAQTGSGLALTTSNAGVGFTVNPALGTMAATTFIGNISGTAATVTNFYGTLVGNSSTATTAQNINTVVADTAGNHYITFSPANGGSGVALSTDGGLAFVPTTNVLTTGVFSGNLSATGATVTTIFDAQGDVSLGNATGDTVTFNARIGSHFNPSSDATYDLGLPSFSWRNAYLDFITGTAVTATNFYGTLTGNSSTATTSANLNTVAATTGTGHYILFSPVNGASGVAVSSDAQLQFSPSTNVLTADIFSGNFTGTAATATNFYGTLTGNVTGTATTATNVNLAAGANNINHSVVFSLNASGTGVGLSSDAGLQYNPSTNVLTADVFSGNHTGTAFTATNFYGTLTGNVTGTATTAQNVNLAAGANNVNHSIVFSLNASGTGVGLSSDGSLLYNPSTNVLSTDVFSGNFTGTAATATNFYGTLTGNSSTATTSQNINTMAATTGTGHYLLFSPVNGGSGIAVSSDAQLQFSPSTNVLTVDTFSGNLSGTAATATNFYGTLTGNVTGTATTAQNINTTAATTGGAHYLLFSPVNATTSGVAVSSDAQLQFNPGTNVLTADVFSGNLSGTAATATNFYGTLTGNVNGNVTGTATTAQNVNVTATTLSNNFYLTFASASFGSGLALSTSSVGAGLTFNPATSSLSAVLFTGTATSSRNIDVSSTPVSSNFNLLFTSASSGSGLALSTSSVGVGLTFNPATSSLSAVLFTGTATTSRNSVVTTTNVSTDHHILFANTSSGSGLALSTSSVGVGLTFNPATSSLSAVLFTGTASTSRNVSLTTTALNSIHYLTFANAQTGSGLALTTSNAGVGFTVNPALNTLAAGTFIGNVSGSATTSTYITGILRNTSYVLGDLLAGASLGNTLTRVPVGANDRYFLKPDSTTQSGLGWSTFAGVFVTSLAPASPAFTLVEGDLWYKVDDGSFNVYYTDVDETAQWVEIVSSGGGSGGGAGAAGGSAFEVQYNSGGVLDGDPNLVWGPSTPSLSIKGFPTEVSTGCALQILGPAKTITASTGTFLGMNSASGYAGVFIEVRNNDVMKFTVEDDGATYIANLTSNGTVYSNSGYLTNSNPSDQNLKENIQSMIGGTSIVNQLNPVSFEWKSDKNGTGTKYGFIAQEVQEIIPDIVSIDSSGTIGIDTVSIIPFLVKSIKEQQETIEQLRAEIQFIKTELGI
jgi:hypothetical protein